MNDQPKTIWKQPWRGPGRIAVWFLLLVAATFLIVCGIGLLGGGGTSAVDTVLSALVISLCFAVVALLALLFIRWISCWRNFKRFFFGLACLATLFALFHVVENVRGRAAWRKLQQEAAERNEPLNLDGIIPPVIPDSENFAMAPVFVGVRNEMDPEWRRAHSGPGGLTNDQSFLLTAYRTNRSSGSPSVGGWMEGERIDLAAWQRYYREPKWDDDSDPPASAAVRYGLGPPPTITDVTASAPVVNEFPTTPQPQSPAADVLLALSKYDAVVEELQQASQRPHARFPVRYEDGFNALLPHLSKLKGASQFFALRAVAELESGQAEPALADVQLGFRLTETLQSEPLLISQLVRIAQTHIALQPVWEGLAQSRWTDAQLAKIEETLCRQDFLADYQRGMRGERACSIWAVDFLRRTRDPASIGVGGEMTGRSAESVFRRFVFRLIVPGGWFDQNKVSLARTHLDLIQPAVDQEARVCSPVAVQRLNDAYESQFKRMTPYNIFTKLVVPALGRAAEKFARGQASVNLARVACALERHRLAHGSYPESLDALMPAFLSKLPHDIINGQPFKYRRTGDDQFVLYSVGWNETDDGGEVALTKKGKADWSKGDWVWRYPTK